MDKIYIVTLAVILGVKFESLNQHERGSRSIVSAFAKRILYFVEIKQSIYFETRLSSISKKDHIFILIQ